MDEPRAVAVVRAALRRLGLSDDETTRFLAILARDLSAGALDERAAIHETCERFVKTVPDAEKRFGGTALLSQRMQKILEILTLGVLSAFIYDLFKAGFSNALQHEPPSDETLPDVHPGKADADVAGADLLRGPPYTVGGLKRARRCLHLTVSKAAARCSLSRDAYVAAERGLPVSSGVAERIKVGILRECSLKGVILWCLEARDQEGNPPVGPNTLFFAPP